jgi:formylglycine-generating enzyme required for sulfatase activity
MRFWLLILLISVSAIAALADPNNLSNGVLIAHYPQSYVYSSGNDECAAYYSDYAISNASEQCNRIDTVYPAYDNQCIWYVIAAFPEDKNWCGVQFGLGDYDNNVFYLTSSSTCLQEALEFPTGGWPNPNEGTHVISSGIHWEGNYLPIYWFQGYTYLAGNGDFTPTLIAITEDPSQGFIGFNNCEVPSGAFVAAGGAMGIFTDGIFAEPGPPAPCCFDNGYCEMLYDFECNGTVYYDEDACDPNPCPDITDPNDLSGGVLIAHNPPNYVYSEDNNWCAAYFDNYAIMDAFEQSNRIDNISYGNSPHIWYVIAAFSEDKIWCGTTFGLGNYDTEVFYLIGSNGNQCLDESMTTQTSDWPMPNSGIDITATTTLWEGNYLPIYCFQGYTYLAASGDFTPTIIPITEDPSQGFIGFTNCEPLSDTWPAVGGGMGIFSDGYYVEPTSSSVHPEVCCYDDGYCEMLLAINCTGTVLYSEYDCSPNPCPQPIGACCQDNVCSIATEVGCLGHWLGEDTTCTPNPCVASGACCQEGICNLTTVGDCSGDWLGIDTTCEPNPCPQFPGACCFDDDNCSITTADDCHGGWLGAYTTCDPNPCDGFDGMVLVPSGTFTMGDGVSSCGHDQFEVTLTHDYYIGQHEVTNQEYMAALQWAFDNGYVTVDANWVYDNLDGSTERLLDIDSGYFEIQFDGEDVFYLEEALSTYAQSAYPDGYDPADHPVKVERWFGAVRYCDWLSLQEDLARAYDLVENPSSADWFCNNGDPYGAVGYRLLTDAEWEYAAQWNDERIYPWGESDPDCSKANYSPNWPDCCIGWTAPVGSYPGGTSALDLSDMAGNVYEWCNDWWVCDLGIDSVTDPTGPSSGDRRVLRSGSWHADDSSLRCSGRSTSYPIGYNRSNGFRIARTRLTTSDVETNLHRRDSQPLLDINKPNPFTGLTQITYSVPSNSSASLVIYDVSGRLIRKLVTEQQSGEYTVSWDGTNDVGDPVEAGAYFYRLTVGEESVSKRMLLVK